MPENTLRPLTPKQRSFVNEYLIDKNASAAALRAGFSPKSAAAIGNQLIAKTNIKAAINEALAAQEKRVLVTADEVLLELRNLAFLDIAAAFNEDGSLKPLKDMPPELRRAISGIDTDEINAGTGEQRKTIGYTRKLRFWNKPEALNMLGKHLKMFSENHVISGSLVTQVELSEDDRIYLKGIAESLVKTKAALG